MNWYYKILGGHTHVRVFMNGAKCGDLVFRNEEFQQIIQDPRTGLPEHTGQVSVGNTHLKFIEEEPREEDGA